MPWYFPRQGRALHPDAGKIPHMGWNQLKDTKARSLTEWTPIRFLLRSLILPDPGGRRDGERVLRVWRALCRQHLVRRDPRHPFSPREEPGIRSALLKNFLKSLN